MGFSGDRTVMMQFDHTPFPLKKSADAKAFFDITENGRRGHTSLGGAIYWEDAHYQDNHVLISMPPAFSLTKSPYIVVFLHGNQAMLERDVKTRQLVPKQVALADVNALLVAPQFAVDAADSSAGNFAAPGNFTNFLSEVGERVGDWQFSPKYTDKLRDAPVILVAYSGGYRAAAHILQSSESSERVAGVVLMDGLYGFEDTFADWITVNRHRSFFFSAYIDSAGTNNDHLQQLLQLRGIEFNRNLPDQLTIGSVSFLRLASDTNHFDFLNRAWTDLPLSDLLQRVRLF